MAIWNFDPAHSTAEFSVKHMMFTTVRGQFPELDGKLEFDPENPGASTIEATINVNSVNTRAADRDNHLCSPDFFDVENHPHMTFKSTNVEMTGDNTAKVTGDLTIRGTTRQVTFDVDYLGQGVSPFGDTRAGFNGTTRINREDFGLTWNAPLETGGVLVGKEVDIIVELQAVRVTEEKTASAQA